jgi:hypothetical protein
LRRIREVSWRATHRSAGKKLCASL